MSLAVLYLITYYSLYLPLSERDSNQGQRVLHSPQSTRPLGHRATHPTVLPVSSNKKALIRSKIELPAVAVCNCSMLSDRQAINSHSQRLWGHYHKTLLSCHYSIILILISLLLQSKSIFPNCLKKVPSWVMWLHQRLEAVLVLDKKLVRFKGQEISFDYI